MDKIFSLRGKESRISIKVQLFLSSQFITVLPYNVINIRTLDANRSKGPVIIYLQGWAGKLKNDPEKNYPPLFQTQKNSKPPL